MLHEVSLQSNEIVIQNNSIKLRDLPPTLGAIGRVGAGLQRLQWCPAKLCHRQTYLHARHARPAPTDQISPANPSSLSRDAVQDVANAPDVGIEGGLGGEFSCAVQTVNVLHCFCHEQVPNSRSDCTNDSRLSYSSPK